MGWDYEILLDLGEIRSGIQTFAELTLAAFDYFKLSSGRLAVRYDWEREVYVELPFGTPRAHLATILAEWQATYSDEKYTYTLSWGVQRYDYANLEDRWDLPAEAEVEMVLEDYSGAEITIHSVNARQARYSTGCILTLYPGSDYAVERCPHVARHNLAMLIEELQFFIQRGAQSIHGIGYNYEFQIEKQILQYHADLADFAADVATIYQIPAATLQPVSLEILREAVRLTPNVLGQATAQGFMVYKNGIIEPLATFYDHLYALLKQA